MGDLRITDLFIEYAVSGGDPIRPIHGLNLQIEAGSLVVVLGPSGCGKTTLLSCLGGILSPTSGQIQFGAIEVTALGRRELTAYRRRTVGIVFQAFNLVASLTALENVMVPMWAAGWTQWSAQERARELLTNVGLHDRMTHRPGHLSGGQQQRVAVARALALDPPLILADEPTAQLDFARAEEVLRLLRALAAGDRIVVIATHDTRVLPLADVVIQLAPTFAPTYRGQEAIPLTRGAVLLDQGGIEDLIYIVAEGEVEIVPRSADPGEGLLKIGAPGDYAGKLGPLFHIPRSAKVRPRTDATVVSYTVEAFRKQFGAPPVPSTQKTVPHQTVSQQSVPQQTVPEQSVPEQTVPVKTVRRKTVPQETVPHKAVPQETVPHKTVRQKTVPHKTVRQKTVPQKTVPHPKVDPDPPRGS